MYLVGHGETNFTKMKHSLFPFYNGENLLRCCTRISNEETLNYVMRFPILLQRSLNWSKYIILHHDCVVEATLNHIRNFYWIVKGKKRLNRYYKNVFMCKAIQKKAAIPKDTPTLPPVRIQFNYCYENVDLEYAGPLFYKDIVQNKMQKCYMLLFTCSFNRAIHLELTNGIGV